ncbi:long-chain fatty acid--CoA ligase [Thermoactinomyces intermedius]|uniref:Long-chain fatty acid--CoA ligase n=1 Tax=Thermoactinomyces intermedius TaxID=2024 RepID=A0A8I1A584_THEIN|nr:long-chain fatty acid--CoA ligase [Thermoactinomyces intermedius]MBA4548850.1 long-chain fatty acid--CoA ligase [Thermoactinomyces intermedius]MBA4837800.1 long-chain fatty acid--CoA ligase [Thermoactinomyces intermedius]MBH8594728.1 long-chain fatty acid--CoA ligase [Thermoactinomyces intermedius]
MAENEKIWLRHYPPEVPATLDYPEVPLTQFLLDAAKDYPERDAFDFMGKSMTFRELLDEVYRFAAALKELGVQKGECVGIMLPNTPQGIIAYYAVLMVGGIVVQINPLYMKKELKHQLADSGATTIVCLDLVWPRVQEVKPETKLKRVIVTRLSDYLPVPKNWLFQLKSKLAGESVSVNYGGDTYSFVSLVKKSSPEPMEPVFESADDIALLQYTGGTTGLAKGAMLTHRNLVANCCQAEAWLYKAKRTEPQSFVGALPFFHVYGMTTVMNLGMKMAAKIILVPKFDTDLVLKKIQEHKPTFFPGAPTMYVGLINHPKISQYDLSSVDACLSGSAPLPLEVQEKFEELSGGLLVEGYGMTETSPVTHANLLWDRKKSGTIGLPWPDTDARIVDVETGEVLPPGHEGELQVKGPQVMKGYWNRPEETEKVLKDGWMCTGDIAKMDEDGYFYILDRKKDVIIAGGFNIYPREVEDILYEHEAVKEAAVIGVKDDYRGETVKAFIVLKEGHSVTEKELDRFCRERLAKFKVPRLYEFRKELPKSSIGKVLRRVLADEEKERSMQLNKKNA